MRSLLLTGFLFLQFFSACTNEEAATPGSENEDDAARNFIRSVLDQDFDRARLLIVNDSLNNELLNNTERSFTERMDRNERSNYKQSSIQNYQKRVLNDSTTVVYYSNSYRKIKDSILVVRRNNQWLVDLKYTFNGAGTDMLQQLPPDRPVNAGDTTTSPTKVPRSGRHDGDTSRPNDIRPKQ
jgi:hypothetical protein